jgi:hypothetical protein
MACVLLAINYNFIRPHTGLNGKTPVPIAELDLGLEGVKWMALISEGVFLEWKKKVIIYAIAS